LGALRLKKSALLFAGLVVASFVLVACNGSVHISKPPSTLTERVLASQSSSAPTAFAGLIIIDGYNDTVGRGEITAGSSPGLLAVSPERSTLLSFSSIGNQVSVVNTLKETVSGTIPLPGLTTSMIAPNPEIGYIAVPSAPVNGSPAGAVIEMNLTSPSIIATISVPSAQTVVSNSSGSLLLVFSNDSDSITVVTPSLLNTGSPLTVSVPGFDRPVNAIINGTTAYVFNCGAECGGTQASVQLLNLGTDPPTAGTSVPVDGATIGFLSGTTLYVAGNSPTNIACTGETTAATTCGRLDLVDTGSMTVTGSIVITDGYHNRIDMGLNGQLFVGSEGCTTIGNVNSTQPQGEIRGCLSIYNTLNGGVIIPADNGDVTGLQSFTTRYVEYVAEGGHLRVYDTQTDTLLENDFITSGTIIITGFITDIKAVDFF
jgi:hypothetical protein